MYVLDIKRRRTDSEGDTASPSTGTVSSIPTDHTTEGNSSESPSYAAPTSPKEYPAGAGPTGRDSASTSGESIRSAGTASLPEQSSSTSPTPTPTTVAQALQMCAASEMHLRRSPIEMLCRIFPHMKRSVLQLILQGCNNDLVQAIEQVLNNHSEHAVGGQSTPNPAAALLSHRPYAITSPPPANGSTSIKSAFSPISTLPSPPTSSIRYAYNPGTRGLALAMPYPPGFMPNLATLGYSYGAALANSQKSALHYGICSCPYGTSSPDK